MNSRSKHKPVLLLGLVVSCFTYAQQPTVEEGGENGIGDETEIATQVVQQQEAAGADSALNTTSSPQQDPAADNSYALLFERMQKRLRSLESNVSSLQGRIEKLEFELQESQHNQQRRIANMEQRIHQALSGNVSSGNIAVDGDSTPVDIVAVTTPGSDESFYAQGMNSIRNQDYPTAIEFFEELLQQFPNSKYAPDSMYWIGEVSSSFAPLNLEKARQKFVQLIRLYDGHDQVPNALYKLGTVYHQLGDEARAMEYLNEVMAKYPQHEVVELARQYADELK